jgi:hypothetical protein
MIGAAVTLIATVVAWVLIERKAVAPSPEAAVSGE